MLGKYFFIFGFLALTIISCDNFKETAGGLQYKIVEDVEGETADIGDMMMLHMKYSNAKDTFNTYQHGAPINALIDSSLVKPGTIEEGLLNLSIGDSAIFKVNNKVLYEDSFQEDVPEEVNPDERTTFFIKVDSIIKKDLLKQEQTKALEQQMAIVEAYKNQLFDSAAVTQQVAKEESLINDYVEKKGLDFSKTEHGVYVAVVDSGKGDQVEIGKRVSLDYTAKLLSDSVFQTSEDVGEAFTFVPGAGQAVLGWDEGLTGLREGSNAVVILPSPLAFGGQGIPGKSGYVVPPNTPVVFEIKVNEVTEL